MRDFGNDVLDPFAPEEFRAIDRVAAAHGVVDGPFRFSLPLRLSRHQDPLFLAMELLERASLPASDPSASVPVDPDAVQTWLQL